MEVQHSSGEIRGGWLAVKHASDRYGWLDPEARFEYPESRVENFCNKLGRCIDYYIDVEAQTSYIAFGYRAAAA